MKKIIQTAKRIISIIRKKYIIYLQVKEIGGNGERILLRKIRQETLVGEKRKVASSMLTDWKMGLIKPPLDSEREEFELMVGRRPNSTLSWKKIHGIQKKYWDEGNI